MKPLAQVQTNPGSKPENRNNFSFQQKLLSAHPDNYPLCGEAEEGHLHLGVVGPEHHGLEGDDQLEEPLLRVGPALLPHVVQGRLGEVQPPNGHPHWLGRQGSRCYIV